jgi:putative Mg2+ transporter-C (MgtC) family protein
MPELSSLLTPTDLKQMLQVALAFILGGAIGWERERRRRPAGLRTHMLVCAGSACFAIASAYGYEGLGTVRDPARIAAQIVTGVGFLGAGTIWRTQDTVRGLTTAASIWLAAAIGLLIGANLTVLAVFVTVLALGVLWFLNPLSTQIAENNGTREADRATPRGDAESDSGDEPR